MTHLEEYNRIVERRKSNPLPEDQYGENHHIVPKSICPMLAKSNENIVRLSAQEHFLAHYHLWLAYRDELKEKKWARKMCYAINRMKRQLIMCDDIEVMSELYQKVRLEYAKVHSESMKGRQFHKGRHHSDQSKKLISEKVRIAMNNETTRQIIKQKLLGNQNRKGCHFTDEEKTKISEGVSLFWKHNKAKWFNNGVLEIRAVECPDGFQAGRIRRVV